MFSGNLFLVFLSCGVFFDRIRLTDVRPLSRHALACVAGVIGEGEGERGGLGRGERERLPQEPHSLHFCVRWQTQISGWLIFDSKSLEKAI